MKRKVYAIITAISILLLAVISTQAYQEEDLVAKETESLEVYEKMLEAFTSDDAVVYPDYYAGVYIDSLKNLVVMLTNTATDEDIQAIREIAGSTEIIFELNKEYSWNYLLELQEEIVGYCTESYSNSEIYDNLKTVDIIDQENQIEIGVESLTNEYAEDFITTIFEDVSFYKSEPSYDSLPICFVEIPDITEESSATEVLDEDIVFPPVDVDTGAVSLSADATKLLNPGVQFIVARKEFNNAATATISFPAKRTTEEGTYYGFVTCGHSSPVPTGVNNAVCGWEKATGEPEAFGILQYSVAKGSVDSAFVALGNGFECGDMLMIEKVGRQLAAHGGVVAGTTVYAHGYETSELKGTVRSTSHVAHFSDKKLDFEATLTDLYSVVWSGGKNLAPGDSGTPLYIYQSSTSTRGPIIILGTLCGASGSTSDSFCKISNILADKNLNIRLTF